MKDRWHVVPALCEEVRDAQLVDRAHQLEERRDAEGPGDVEDQQQVMSLEMIWL